MRTILITVVFFGLSVTSIGSATSEAIGLASGTTGAPHAPEACTIAPRTIADLKTLAATPVAAPPAEAGIEIDSELVEALTNTVNQSLACTNANRPLAAFALFTDHYLSQRFSGPGLDDLGHLEAALTRNSLPADEVDWISLVSVEQVAVTADGRVIAVVTTANGATRFNDQLAFAREREQWLIDEVIMLDPPATPVVGDATS